VPVWSAEVELDEGLVRRLIGQFPELPVRSVRLLAEGWDNAVWVANERYAFRFPRRRIAIRGVELELELLPKLAPLLPLPVPDPVFRGRPADGYPWPFFGSELLPGRETCDAELDDDARLEIALQLAPFLRALHALDLDEPLPLDANARADMTVRVSLTREQLAARSSGSASGARPRSSNASSTPRSASLRQSCRPSSTATCTSVTCSSRAGG
jgi:aminoglycoside phosphotransferase (APT) family kinase protein